MFRRRLLSWQAPLWSARPMYFAECTAGVSSSRPTLQGPGVKLPRYMRTACQNAYTSQHDQPTNPLTTYRIAPISAPKPAPPPPALPALVHPHPRPPLTPALLQGGEAKPVERVPVPPPLVHPPPLQGGGEAGAGQAGGARAHPCEGIAGRAHCQDQRAAAGVDIWGGEVWTPGPSTTRSDIVAREGVTL